MTKLVKVNSQTFLNPDHIESIRKTDSRIEIGMTSGEQLRFALDEFDVQFLRKVAEKPEKVPGK